MRPDSQRLIDSSQQHFNPRTREGCDSKHELTKLTEAYNFNPRTREGCDFLPEQIALYHLIISIHAPVKGATRTLFMQLFAHDCDFNPRTREGCDHVRIATTSKATIISIHAPVKGATDVATYGLSYLNLFQSTHP